MTLERSLSICNEGVPVPRSEMSGTKPPALTKLLFHIIDGNVLPNAGHFNQEPEHTIHAAARLLQGKPIDLCEYMIWIMKKVRSQPKNEHGKRNNYDLPFGNMFTTIFKHFGVNVAIEEPSLETTVFNANSFAQYLGWVFVKEVGVYRNRHNDDVRKYIDGAVAPCPPAIDVPGTLAYKSAHGKAAAGSTSQPVSRQLFVESGAGFQFPSSHDDALAAADDLSTITPATIVGKLLKMEDDHKGLVALLAAGNKHPSAASSSSGSQPPDMSTIIQHLLDIKAENTMLKDFITTSLRKNQKAVAEIVDNKLERFYEMLYKQTDDIGGMFTRHSSELYDETLRKKEWEKSLEGKVDKYWKTLFNIEKIITSNFKSIKDLLNASKDAFVSAFARREPGVFARPDNPLPPFEDVPAEPEDVQQNDED